MYIINESLFAVINLSDVSQVNEIPTYNMQYYKIQTVNKPYKTEKNTKKLNYTETQSHRRRW